MPVECSSVTGGLMFFFGARDNCVGVCVCVLRARGAFKCLFICVLVGLAGRSPVSDRAALQSPNILHIHKSIGIWR